jgi:hypothetical protein
VTAKDVKCRVNEISWYFGSSHFCRYLGCEGMRLVQESQMAYDLFLQLISNYLDMTQHRAMSLEAGSEQRQHPPLRRRRYPPTCCSQFELLCKFKLNRARAYCWQEKRRGGLLVSTVPIWPYFSRERNSTRNWYQWCHEQLVHKF